MTSDSNTIERGFLLAEDEALKAKLSDLWVAAPRAPGGRTRVKVWFGMPGEEKIRTYPYITINLIDVVFANDRAHSAQVQPVDYWPSEYASFVDYAAANDIVYDPDNQDALAVWWHPYDLHYQIAVHTRSAQHDRALMAQLLRTQFLPDRWGFLHVPADDSDRHLIRIGFTQADYYEGAGLERKRVFRKIYSVTVTADVPPFNPVLYYKVLEVSGRLIATTDPELTTTWTNTSP